MGGGGCDGQVTGMTQFDPVGSDVLPKVEDLETDSKKAAASLTASD
jgi:hypothetical protein